jgi:hypothetical protein
MLLSSGPAALADPFVLTAAGVILAILFAVWFVRTA